MRPSLRLLQPGRSCCVAPGSLFVGARCRTPSHGMTGPTPRRRRLHAMATTTEDLQATTPVVTVTPEAHKIVREAMEQEPDPGSLALWLEVRGVQAGSFVYDLYF